MTIPTKTCNGCKRELELGYFNKSPCVKDGFSGTCRRCVREKYKESPRVKAAAKPAGKRRRPTPRAGSSQKTEDQSRTNEVTRPAKQSGPLRLKTNLNAKEIEELIDRVEQLEEILSRGNVQVLLDNDAVHDDDVEDLIFSRVRVLQILKLLGAKKVASKQNVRPDRPWRRYWS